MFALELEFTLFYIECFAFFIMLSVNIYELIICGYLKML